ncbi:lipoyl(octanoyl) transferase LipB [Candidatus Bipolaricaulota bacterium]|nr:lipoyl(octanoyl) transferase LipB [Candidatus Bipolaricaulota bacterium]
MSSRTLHLDLGRAGYEGVLRLQRELHARRCEATIPDAVITVEHDPVFTIGRSGSLDHLLVERERLDAEGIGLCEVERGGDITYHGPGQLVVYPIVDLRQRGRDVKRFITDLEETAIRTLRVFGIDGGRRPGYPGVWVAAPPAALAPGTYKIASIGVYVKQWVTRHGLALNVAVNPEHFAMIRPCGLDVAAVSTNDLLVRAVSLGRVRDAFLAEMAGVFGWAFETASPEEIG